MASYQLFDDVRGKHLVFSVSVVGFGWQRLLKPLSSESKSRIETLNNGSKTRYCWKKCSDNVSTKRDKIWASTLREIEFNRAVSAKDIQESIEGESPSLRTVRNTLDSMEEMGFLGSTGGVGSAPRRYYAVTPDAKISPSGYESRASSHSSVFPYPGGKSHLADWIIRHLPDDHDTYVEVFGGSGDLLYNKQKSKYEIFNDLSRDIVQFFSVLRDRPDDLADWVKSVPYSRRQYQEWAEEYYNGHRADDEVARAGRFFCLRYMQYAGVADAQNGFRTRARRSPARSFNTARERIDSFARRFDEVVIEQKHYKRILKEYDDSSAAVVFYLDPPYRDSANHYGVDVDFAELVDCLRSVRNRWMLSCTTVPEGLESYPRLERESRHQMSGSGGSVTEKLVCNFDIQSTSAD